MNWAELINNYHHAGCSWIIGISCLASYILYVFNQHRARKEHGSLAFFSNLNMFPEELGNKYSIRQYFPSISILIPSRNRLKKNLCRYERKILARQDKAQQVWNHFVNTSVGKSISQKRWWKGFIFHCNFLKVKTWPFAISLYVKKGRTPT